MGALMLTMLPDARWPMFRVGQPQDPPGFRLSNDGSAGTPPGDSGVASFARYLPGDAGPLVPPDPGGPPYASDGGVYPVADQAYEPVDGNPPRQDTARADDAGAGDNRPGFLDRFQPFITDAQNAAEAVGTRANAVVNGAYSVFPGTYNAIRALGRGTGVLGPEESRRFGQEADFIGDSLGQIAKHPGLALRTARAALPILAKDPLLPYYAAGRLLMGGLTRLGPVATIGDALRAVEDGHNFLNSVFYHGIQGIPSKSP
jgi:hypothetical protein